jgi:hypothetical protein
LEENKNRRPNADTKQTDGQTRINWIGSNIQSLRANICKVTYTREEIMILFGESQRGPMRQKELNILLTDRIVLSPLIAQRLGAALNNVIQDYESKYGPLEIESPLQTKGGRIASPGKKLPLSNLKETADKSGLIFQLIENHNLEFGYERSFKMAENTLLGNRFLLGIDKEEKIQEKLLDICKQMDMPKKYLVAFQENLSDANLVLFGFEENERSCVYKVYLEFWEKLKNKLQSKPNKTEPVLLHLGFKWDALDNNKGVIAKYTCYPLLPVKNILNRLSNIYDVHKDRTSLEIAKDIINLAASRIVNDSFIYLEASEDNNPRRSFDINLYKANLQLKDIYPLLSKMRRHYSISSDDFDFLYDQVSTKIFGHLSGGIDREGKDFLTIYYEISAVSGKN